MEIAVIIVFVVGYLMITFEHALGINKTATALLTGVLCWTVYILSSTDTPHHISEKLLGQLGEISGILFFLMGAMTIVELIDSHDGFEVITKAITTTSKRKLLWIICLLSFFLSAVLDNLTTTIVLGSLLRKLIDNKNDRMLFIGLVVVSANAGGVWSPIGDVTTTMLWIGGQITAKSIIGNLLLPSLICILVPLSVVTLRLKGKMARPALEYKSSATRFARNFIFFSGLGVLLLVPVFKTLTHLPPFMGMLLGLGILWVISEIIHRDKDESDKNNFSVLFALRKIDMPSVLFFMGILLAIGTLQSTGQLKELAGVMNEKIGDTNIIVLSIGLLSAVVDNVPLVAASMGMYDLQNFPTDHYFWNLLAYSAGTGGSVLIIGSAAGVAAMGMEKMDFFWYIKRISFLALLGYFSGALVYIVMN